MRKSKYSENQIIAILKAVEAGRTVRDVCRQNVSDLRETNMTLSFPGVKTSLVKSS